ncbi:MAG TPA: MFS transporter [Solirubrobacterales bacterium]|jgi:EmrB/QacA subfamily drug resistance transporter|nr:MFS transporter [Solirubrobacterales bacterium]
MTDPSAARDKRWIALILLCVAQFMVVLDSAIVNVALPTIGTALDFSESSLPWVVNAYVLTFGGFLLLGGRLADLLGRRRVLLFGLVLFSLASLAGGLATNSGQLIAARAVQGLGAAILSPAALSIVTTTFKDGAERNKALGIWGGVAGSGAAAGVLLGGILTEGLGWEWVLWVNVPIGIAAVLIAPTLIAESRDEEGVRRFDIAGALTITLGISALVFALLDAESAGWGSVQTIGTLAASALLLAAFVAIERSSRAPLVPFSIFRSRTVTGANVVGILTGAALLSMFFLISLYMQQVLGYSPIKAGLSYLPLAGSIIISAGVASQLVTKVGFKPILAIGMALIAAGLAWFSQISVHGSFLGDILGPSLLAAVGLGLAFVPLTIAAVSGIEDREQGLASGLINTSEQVGGALGLAILAAVANGIINGSHDPVVLTEGFQSAFLVGAAFAVFGLIATLLLMRSSDSTAQVELSSGAAAAACSSSSEAAAVACASSSATATAAALQGAQAEGQARGGIATTSRISENGPQGGDGT